MNPFEWSNIHWIKLNTECLVLNDYQKISEDWKDDGNIIVHVDSGDSNGREYNVEIEEVGAK